MSRDTRTRAALERRNRELTILNRISEATNRSVSLRHALDTTLTLVLELLELDTGWIWLLDDETGNPYLAAGRNLPPALAGESERMQGSCYCLKTYMAGDMDGAANINVIECSRLFGLVDGTNGFQFHSSIPLYLVERQLGVLNVASTDWRELSEDDLRILHTVSDLLAAAIERTRLHAQASRLAAIEERNRLARELHDTLAQGLAGIAMQLETADARLDDGETAGAQSALVRALEMTRTGMEEARRSVMDLRAAPLEGRSLSEALESIARDTARESGLKVACDTEGARRPLPARIETGLLRIAQEALTNVTRHAAASQVRLRVTASADALHLVIADNGAGFDPTHAASGRFGLIGMTERARLMGGELLVESTAGEGTRIRAIVPLDPPPPGAPDSDPLEVV